MGIREDRFTVALRMPHRTSAGDDCLDIRLESELGRIHYQKRISLSEYEAGVRYAQIVLHYLQSTDAPTPYGRDEIEISDEACLRRKLDMAAANTVLKAVDRKCRNVVDRVAVYNEPLRDGELDSLRSALRVLAGE